MAKTFKNFSSITVPIVLVVAIVLSILEFGSLRERLKINTFELERLRPVVTQIGMLEVQMKNVGESLVRIYNKMSDIEKAILGLR